MNLIDRVKKIIVSPKAEWSVINTEAPNTSGIITGYVLPLTLAAAVATFIGYAFIGVDAIFIRIRGVNWGIYQALVVFINVFLCILISTFVIDALASSFGSEKNMGRSFQLVAYSLTPLMIGSLVNIIPVLAIVGLLFSLYGFYIYYVGMPILKKTPEDKHVGYFVVSIIVIIVVYFVLGYILARLFLPIFGLSYGVPSIDMDGL